jgi:hypothetical protein
MSIRFRWYADDSDLVQRGIRKWVEPLARKELEKSHVKQHLARVARKYLVTWPDVVVKGVRLPQDLLFRVVNMVQKGKMVSLDLAHSYETKGVKRGFYRMELKGLLHTLHSFWSGGEEAVGLMLFSRTAGPRKKKKLKTILNFPSTMLHVPKLRGIYEQIVDEDLQFSVSLPRAIAGLISSARWAIEAAKFCFTDSAYFIELQFKDDAPTPEVRFNTGRELSANPLTPWVAGLLNSATYTIADQFFAKDEAPIFISVILGPRHHVFTGVRVAGQSAGTSGTSPAPGPAEPEGTDGPDGSAADSPAPEPDTSTSIGASPSSPDRPPPS